MTLRHWLFVVELAILLNKIIDTFDVVTPLEFMDLLIFFSFLRKKKDLPHCYGWERMKEKRIGGSCLFTTTEKKRNQLIPHLFSVQFGWKWREISTKNVQLYCLTFCGYTFLFFPFSFFLQREWMIFLFCFPFSFLFPIIHGRNVFFSLFFFISFFLFLFSFYPCPLIWLFVCSCFFVCVLLVLKWFKTKR